MSFQIKLLFRNTGIRLKIKVLFGINVDFSYLYSIQKALYGHTRDTTKIR